MRQRTFFSLFVFWFELLISLPNIPHFFFFMFWSLPPPFFLKTHVLFTLSSLFLLTLKVFFCFFSHSMSLSIFEISDTRQVFLSLSLSLMFVRVWACVFVFSFEHFFFFLKTRINKIFFLSSTFFFKKENPSSPFSNTFM